MVCAASIKERLVVPAVLSIILYMNILKILSTNLKHQDVVPPSPSSSALRVFESV